MPLLQWRLSSIKCGMSVCVCVFVYKFTFFFYSSPSILSEVLLKFIQRCRAIKYVFTDLQPESSEVDKLLFLQKTLNGRLFTQKYESTYSLIRQIHSSLVKY